MKIEPTQKAISADIARLIREKNYPQKQAIAIAFSEAGLSNKGSSGKHGGGHHGGGHHGHKSGKK